MLVGLDVVGAEGAGLRVGWSVLVGLNDCGAELGLRVGLPDALVGLDVVGAEGVRLRVGWSVLVGLNDCGAELGLRVGLPSVLVGLDVVGAEGGMKVGRLEYDGVFVGRSVAALDGRKLGWLVDG